MLFVVGSWFFLPLFFKDPDNTDLAGDFVYSLTHSTKIYEELGLHWVLCCAYGSDAQGVGQSVGLPNPEWSGGVAKEASQCPGGSWYLLKALARLGEEEGAERTASPQGKAEKKCSTFGGTESSWWFILPGVWSLRQGMVTDRTKPRKALLAKLQIVYSEGTGNHWSINTSPLPSHFCEMTQ